MKDPDHILEHYALTSLWQGCNQLRVCQSVHCQNVCTAIEDHPELGPNI